MPILIRVNTLSNNKHLDKTLYEKLDPPKQTVSQFIMTHYVCRAINQKELNNCIGVVATLINSDDMMI